MIKKSFVFLVLTCFLLFFATTFVYSSDFSLPEIRSNYIQAMRAMESGNDRIAESSLRWILSVPGIHKGKSEKYFIKASFYLGRIAFNRKDWARAEEFFRQVVLKGGKTKGVSSALYYLARTRIAMGSFTDGLTFMNEYRAKYRNKQKLEADTLYWSAVAYHELKDIFNASRLLEELNRRYPYSRVARMSQDLRLKVQTEIQLQKKMEVAYIRQTNLIVSQSNQIIMLTNRISDLSNRLERQKQRERLLQIILRMQNTLKNLAELKVIQLERFNRLKNREAIREDN